MKKKVIRAGAIIGAALAVGGVLCVMLCDGEGSRYRAECRFVDYPSDEIPTNAVGEVRQPPDFSGGHLESARILIEQVRASQFYTNIVAAYRRRHPGSRQAEADLCAIASRAEITLVGHPIPVFAVSATADDARLAKDMAEAYREAVRQLKESESTGRLQQAARQIDQNVERLRRSVSQLEDAIAVATAPEEKEALQREMRLQTRRLAELAEEGRKAEEAASVRSASGIHPVGEVICTRVSP